MAQFDVYKNHRPGWSKIPFLLDVQSDIVDLATRLILPLVRTDIFGPTITRLNPVVMVGDQELVVSTADMASLPYKELGQLITHLGHDRDRILAAIDLLITGV